MSNEVYLASQDFKRIYQKANELLVSSSVIKEFPFKVKGLVKEQTDIAQCSYDKAHNKYHIDIRQFGSKSAVLMEMQGAHIIFYNQSEDLRRVRFSIMHELGHFLLGHQLNLSKDDILYGKQEVEANCFAAQVLMPEQLLRECVKRGKSITADFIMNTFNVSSEAANKRKQTLAKTTYEWRSREEKEYDDIILFRHNTMIESIAPKVNYYSYSFEDDLEREQERNSWLDSRSRW